MPVPPQDDNQEQIPSMQNTRKGEPDLNHIVLHFPGRQSACTLVAFEPEDSSVGIFGCYIEVEDKDGNRYVLNDGTNWIHPMTRIDGGDGSELLSDDPDWERIVGTYTGELFPEPSAHPPITPRAIIKAIEPGTIFSDTDECEVQDRLDYTFGIGLDTELGVS